MQKKEKVFSLQVILKLFIFIVLVPLLPLLISGRWNWWEAWVYAVVYILTFIISRALAARHSPGILAERGKFMDHADTQPWDKVLAPLLGLGGGLLPFAVGIEARFGEPANLQPGSEVDRAAAVSGRHALGFPGADREQLFLRHGAPAIRTRS